VERKTTVPQENALMVREGGRSRNVEAVAALKKGGKAGRRMSREEQINSECDKGYHPPTFRERRAAETGKKRRGEAKQEEQNTRSSGTGRQSGGGGFFRTTKKNRREERWQSRRGGAALFSLDCIKHL